MCVKCTHGIWTACAEADELALIFLHRSSRQHSCNKSVVLYIHVWTCVYTYMYQAICSVSAHDIV